MILGFKGFKPGLIATLGDGSYQYQPGEVSKTEKAKCANTGFHYCLDPLDCLNWYAWDGKNEFWAIAAGGDIDEDDYRTRSSCTEIVPLRRLKEDEFLLMHANYAFEHLRMSIRQARSQAETFRLNAAVRVLAPPLMPAKTLAQCAMRAALSPERYILQTARYIM